VPLWLVNQAVTVRRIRLLVHRQTTPVVAVAADGSQVLLVVLAVLAAAALAVDSTELTEQVALLELMVLAVAAVVALLETPQRVPVDQELSLFVTRCQTFQHPISILLTTPAPTQTTSHQQPR
jgi:hypothetical protein